MSDGSFDSPAPSAPTFRPGELIAGRYRIDRFLGQGAVGEVYGASDVELSSAVALKLLRPTSGDLHNRERFKREILLARRVSHPNVCRIFDFGVHAIVAEDGRRRELAFLTMELLDGETLARRIEEGGPLPDDEAVRVAVQLCRALSAAEAAGVVHRDLKSANILLVGERVVITDFGLARSERASSAAVHLTEQGGLLGTPAYMSPEQVAGRPATAASDIYSLGVVLYEAVSGALPFTGSSPLSMAIQRLNEPPTPIETYRRDLTPRLKETIARCLERSPEARFASAAEVERFLDPPTRQVALGDLTTEYPPRSADPKSVARRPGVRWLRATAALAGIALAGWLAFEAVHSRRDRSHGDATTAPMDAVPAARRSVAVLGFGNAAGRSEAQWISAALSEMLISEIAAGDVVRAVPGESVARARQDLGIVPSAALGEETLARLRRLLGADFVLVGSYAALGGPDAPLRLDLRLQPTSGESGRAYSFEGRESGLFELARSAGRELRAGLGVRDVPQSSTASASTLPANPEAVRLYAEGLEALRGFEPARARDMLARAVAADPRSAMAQAALAEALATLGYDEEATVAASQAYRLAGALPRAEQLAVEGLFRRLERDWPKAIEIARSLRSFYPDDLELGLRLAGVELESGDARAALETLVALRELSPPAGEDPRIDLLEARTAESLSDYRRQLAVASRAAELAAASGARSVLARARFEKGTALRQLGNTEAAAIELESVRELAAALGDRAEAAGASQALARLELGRGDLARAERLFEEARATFVAIGNRRRAARVDHSLGLVASERGDLAAASALYERARSVLTELGDRRGAASSAANLGTMLYLRWDLAGAESRHQEALAAFRAIEDRRAESVSLANLAQIRRDRADFRGSAKLWSESLEIAHAIGDLSAEASARLGLGENLEIEGEIEPSRAELGRARELFRSADEPPGVGAVDVVLARIDRDSGRGSEAAIAFSRLAREFGERGEADDRLEAELEEARSLLSAPRPGEEAVRRGEAAAAIARRSASAPLRHLGRLVAAQSAFSSGRFAEGRAEIAAGLAAAQAAGHVVAKLELQLAAIELEPARRGEDRRRALIRVAAEARSSGCGRIAKRAERLAAEG